MITLTVARPNGMPYCIEYFKTQADCDVYTKAQAYPQNFTITYKDSSAADARLAAIKLFIDTAPGQLSKIQQDQILVHLIKLEMGQ